MWDLQFAISVVLNKKKLIWNSFLDWNQNVNMWMVRRISSCVSVYLFNRIERLTHRCYRTLINKFEESPLNFTLKVLNHWVLAAAEAAAAQEVISVSVGCVKATNWRWLHPKPLKLAFATTNCFLFHQTYISIKIYIYSISGSDMIPATQIKRLRWLFEVTVNETWTASIVVDSISCDKRWTQANSSNVLMWHSAQQYPLQSPCHLISSEWKYKYWRFRIRKIKFKITAVQNPALFHIWC